MKGRPRFVILPTPNWTAERLLKEKLVAGCKHKGKLIIARHGVNAGKDSRLFKILKEYSR